VLVCVHAIEAPATQGDEQLVPKTDFSVLQRLEMPFVNAPTPPEEDSVQKCMHPQVEAGVAASPRNDKEPDSAQVDVSIAGIHSGADEAMRRDPQKNGISYGYRCPTRVGIGSYTRTSSQQERTGTGGLGMVGAGPANPKKQ